jgi:hypothetical protein
MIDDLKNDPVADARIDAALKRLGSAAPHAGIEERVLARIAKVETRSRSKTSQWFRMPGITFNAALAALACVAIVVGSVSHSRRTVTGPVPGLELPARTDSGVGAASAVHMASQPVAAAGKGRARSNRSTTPGRARVSPQVRKPSGVAVPKTPAAPATDQP